MRASVRNSDERRSHPPVAHLGTGRRELCDHAVDLAESAQHGRQRSGVGALPQGKHAVGDAEQVQGVQQPRSHGAGQAVIGRQEPVGRGQVGGLGGQQAQRADQFVVQRRGRRAGATIGTVGAPVSAW